jgi:hypothetical protein
MNPSEKDLFLKYIDSNEFKYNLIDLTKDILGGKINYIDQSKSKRTKSEKAELDKQSEEITGILYNIVREIRNLIFSLIPIPLPIPDAIKEQLGCKDQVKTLWESHIAPFLRNITNSNKYGRRTNIQSPFSKLDEELEREKSELEKLEEVEDEMEEMFDEELEIEKEKLQIERKIEKMVESKIESRLTKSSDGFPNDLDEDPMQVSGGKRKYK